MGRQKETTKFNVLFKFWYAICQNCSWNVWLSFKDKVCCMFYSKQRVCAFSVEYTHKHHSLKCGLTSYRRLLRNWICYGCRKFQKILHIQHFTQYILFEIKYFRLIFFCFFLETNISMEFLLVYLRDFVYLSIFSLFIYCTSFVYLFLNFLRKYLELYNLPYKII